jgi:hypothetical protein
MPRSRDVEKEKMKVELQKKSNFKVGFRVKFNRLVTNIFL